MAYWFQGQNAVVCLSPHIVMSFFLVMKTLRASSLGCPQPCSLAVLLNGSPLIRVQIPPCLENHQAQHAGCRRRKALGRESGALGPSLPGPFWVFFQQ